MGRTWFVRGGAGRTATPFLIRGGRGETRRTATPFGSAKGREGALRTAFCPRRGTENFNTLLDPRRTRRARRTATPFGSAKGREGALRTAFCPRRGTENFNTLFDPRRTRRTATPFLIREGARRVAKKHLFVHGRARRTAFLSAEGAAGLGKRIFCPRRGPGLAAASRAAIRRKDLMGWTSIRCGCKGGADSRYELR